jgi:c-di-GMP-binding flagellar brake protein YcgR
MEKQEKKSAFDPLSKDEKIQKISVVANTRSDVHVWEKKENKKSVLVATSFEPEEFVLKLSTQEDIPGELFNGPVFIYFEADGHEFFSSGRIDKESEDGKKLSIKMASKIFRFDKRKNLRLPREYVDSCDFAMNRLDGQSFECVDASVGGVAVLVPDEQKDLFSEGRKFKDNSLKINGDVYNVPEVNVNYVKDIGDGKKQVGLVFGDLEEGTKEKLGNEINSLVYEYMDANSKAG